jgi:hypothetical protein
MQSKVIFSDDSFASVGLGHRLRRSSFVSLIIFLHCLLHLLVLGDRACLLNCGCPPGGSRRDIFRYDGLSAPLPRPARLRHRMRIRNTRHGTHPDVTRPPLRSRGIALLLGGEFLGEDEEMSLFTHWLIRSIK